MKGLGTLVEGVVIAFDALRSNKIRAGLTILGVSIGVAVVVAMASVITGIQSSITGAFEAAGPRTFVVMPFDFSGVRVTVNGSNRPPWWDNPEITDAEVRLLNSLPAVQSATGAIEFGILVSRGTERVSDVQARGFYSGWDNYIAGEITAGRDFTELEADEGRPVVVLSDSLAVQLFGQQNPLGRQVRGSSGWRGVNERFTVVGIFTPEDQVFGAVAPYWAIFPFNTANRRLKARNPFTFATVAVVPRPGVELDDAKDEVISALRSRRGLAPSEENNFALMQPTQILELLNRFTSVFFAIMLALSSVALLVGGVGVIGIMLISVTERTREIGIRKAVGATRQEILWQFLVEAGVLTMVGGALGMGFGALATWGVSSFTVIPAEIPLWSVVAALLAAAVTGMVFGLVPGREGRPPGARSRASVRVAPTWSHWTYWRYSRIRTTRSSSAVDRWPRRRGRGAGSGYWT